MYLAIDIGGTKTLIASFSANGQLVKSFRFATPASYAQFKSQLKQAIDDNFGDIDFSMACCGVPSLINHEAGVAIAFGNLNWKHLPIKYDLEQMLGIGVLIENDAKLAGLSEAQLVLGNYEKIYYLTVSTGIGGGYVVNGKLDPDLINTEPGHMMIEHNNKMQKWESFASGKAIYKKYGQKAADINDKKTWHDISENLARGLIDIIALTQPDAVIIGGGVGAHFEKFKTILKEHLEKYANPLVKIPPLLGAKRAEEAVIYGCYELIKQQNN